MKSPDVQFGVLEDYGPAIPKSSGVNHQPVVQRIYMGRLVGVMMNQIAVTD